jgi:hypothetical protein
VLRSAGLLWSWYIGPRPIDVLRMVSVSTLDLTIIVGEFTSGCQ